MSAVKTVPINKEYTRLCLKLSRFEVEKFYLERPTGSWLILRASRAFLPRFGV